MPTTAQECAAGSLAGTLTFPEVVAKLAAVGVERYHADYSRREITYYWPDGRNEVVAVPHEEHPTGDRFDAAAVAEAVRASQQGLHTYADFIRKTTAAGCIGYFVQLTGRQVQYFGRRGEMHVEKFPD